jgi:hypothetical protein
MLRKYSEVLLILSWTIKGDDAAEEYRRTWKAMWNQFNLSVHCSYHYSWKQLFSKETTSL